MSAEALAGLYDSRVKSSPNDDSSSIVAWERLVDLPLWPVAAGLFVLAWVAQFVGHKIEGEKPSFLEDIQFLLVGPAWLLHFIYRKVGIPY